MSKLPNCPDCGATPGQPHEKGCDVEMCSACGNQKISCGCKGKHDQAFARWTGFLPGELEAEKLGINLNQFHVAGLHKIFFVKPEVKRRRHKHK
jgi:hypothetical protein